MGTVDFSKIKVLVTDGDSWTAGDIVDPVLFKDEPWHVNHPDNRPYRLPRVWPHKLAKRLGIECINISNAGSSNDGILRRTLNQLDKVLETYKPEEIFYIVGWSSPERKDFFYKSPENHAVWETMYPGEIHHFKGHTDSIDRFYREYVMSFWNSEEFITRYIQHNLTLHYFFKAHNIQHLFFDAFYESKEAVMSPKHSIRESKKLYSVFLDMMRDKDRLESLQLTNPLKKYNKIVESNFVDTSFNSYILDREKELDRMLITFHPNEEGHELWAEYLHRFLTQEGFAKKKG